LSRFRLRLELSWTGQSKNPLLFWETRPICICRKEVAFSRLISRASLACFHFQMSTSASGGGGGDSGGVVDGATKFAGEQQLQQRQGGGPHHARRGRGGGRGGTPQAAAGAAGAGGGGGGGGTGGGGGNGGSGGRPRNLHRYKTELCRAWQENRQCKYGEKCQVSSSLCLLPMPSLSSVPLKDFSADFPFSNFTSSI
jgi:hypothetical protein